MATRDAQVRAELDHFVQRVQRLVAVTSGGVAGALSTLDAVERLVDDTRHALTDLPAPEES